MSPLWAPSARRVPICLVLSATENDVSPTAIRLGKAAFYELRALDEEAAYHSAIDVMTDNALRHDAQEGIAAFLQKRPASWSASSEPA